MVTTLSSTEFENIWNTIVNREKFDPDYNETHWGIGSLFNQEEIEKNKPKGWEGLRNIIDDIEKRCAVYYYCVDEYGEKVLYFIVFGENAMDEIATIAVQLRKMKEQPCLTLEDEKIWMRTSRYKNGTGDLSDTLTARCPLF